MSRATPTTFGPDGADGWDAPWTAEDGDPGPRRLVAALHRRLPELDRDLVERAWRVAARAHAGQRRQSGEPYITHPLGVAELAADLGLDLDTVLAAVLHDTVEDTPVTLEQLRAMFGDDVARLVDGVTKLDAAKAGVVTDGLSDAQVKSRTKAETLRKMLVAMTDDLRILLLKLCDRTHNAGDWAADYIPADKRRRLAAETREVFVPLAARLGVWELKSRLEDLCFKAEDPEAYQATRLAIARSSPRSSKTLARVTTELGDAMTEAGLAVHVEGRTKSLWSAHRKATDRGIPVDQLHDLLGVRVIVAAGGDLYRALGVLHATYNAVPGTFDDYVSVPKHNSYQSLHSTVMVPGADPSVPGQQVEVQVRTHEQHLRAEFGAASHFSYKDHSSAWVDALTDRAAMVTDPDEFLEALKEDLVRGELFVFTRDGDALRLPEGATPIDLAYAIHTDVGDHCVGARVNGRTAPLRRRLAQGDQVEVVTDDDAPGPRADWLNSVVTPRAREAITRHLKRRRRDADRDGGLRELRLALGEQGLDESLLTSEALESVAALLRSGRTVDDMLEDVGTGELPAGKVVAALVAAGHDGRRVVTVRAVDRVGLLADAATVLADHGVPITAVHTESTDDGLARLTLTVAEHEQRTVAIDRLRSLAGVVEVSADA